MEDGKLSPNDPRAVVEDPVIMHEEELLRKAGKRFLFAFRIAAVALIAALLIPSGPDYPDYYTTVRWASLGLGIFLLGAGLVLSLPSYLEYHRSRSGKNEKS